MNFTELPACCFSKTNLPKIINWIQGWELPSQGFLLRQPLLLFWISQSLSFINTCSLPFTCTEIKYHPPHPPHPHFLFRTTLWRCLLLHVGNPTSWPKLSKAWRAEQNRQYQPKRDVPAGERIKVVPKLWFNSCCLSVVLTLPKGTGAQKQGGKRAFFFLGHFHISLHAYSFIWLA